jgi:hypothetical protein
MAIIGVRSLRETAVNILHLTEQKIFYLHGNAKISLATFRKNPKSVCMQI